jgi:hypothetical protein
MASVHNPAARSNASRCGAMIPRRRSSASLKNCSAAWIKDFDMNIPLFALTPGERTLGNFYFHTVFTTRNNLIIVRKDVIENFHLCVAAIL